MKFNSPPSATCRSWWPTRRKSSRRIERFYGQEENESFSEILKELDANKDIAREVSEAGDDAKAAEALANEVPIVKFVNLVLQQAVQDRASDIHFEPFETEFRIRYRVDGALYEMAPPPKHLALPVTSRIKVMANLNISEKRLPQDGRINLMVAGKQIDLRVSCLPTAFGESIVLRVLDRSSVNLEVESLGLPKYVYDFVTEVIQRPNGIFVVTGPTGCGKTTTLYSCLRRVNTIDSKLLTAEDPVEFDIEGIMQVAVNEAQGMTFAKALKSFLRQDPDIIMVGEMRDLETAQISIQASLTGHLVLSTLHTNDSPGAVTRLVDMGVEPFLISSTLMAVLGQRLVRTICKAIRNRTKCTKKKKTSIGSTQPRTPNTTTHTPTPTTHTQNTHTPTHTQHNHAHPTQPRTQHPTQPRTPNTTTHTQHNHAHPTQPRTPNTTTHTRTQPHPHNHAHPTQPRTPNTTTHTQHNHAHPTQPRTPNTTTHTQHNHAHPTQPRTPNTTTHTQHTHAHPTQPRTPNTTTHTHNTTTHAHQHNHAHTNTPTHTPTQPRTHQHNHARTPTQPRTHQHNHAPRLLADD